MSKIVFILGAGVEKTKGIDFPLAFQLLPEIVKFSESEEGKKFDNELRSCLKGLRFNLRTFIKSAVDNFNTTTSEEIKDIIEKLNPIIHKEGDSHSGKKARLLKKLLETVNSVRLGSKIDDSTYELIKEVLGENIISDIADESIISFNKLDFTDSFKVVIKHILRESIDNTSDEVGNILSSQVLDFEKILIDTFLGFYLEKNTEIKKYLYVSWMLWAYLITKNNECNQKLKNQKIPFYDKFLNLADYSVITFNYTSFLDDSVSADKALYFHGYLKEYIRLDNRDFFKIEKMQFENPFDFFKNNISNVFDFENNVFLIPGIIPPLKLKPVLSQEFIERWYRANDLIKNADKIVVIGYSFAYADEHFNDLLRKNASKEIIIINPEYEFMKSQVARLLGKSESGFTKTQWKSKFDMFQSGKVKIIKAFANDIDFNEL